MFDQVQIWTKSAPVCWKLFHNAKEERTEGKKDCRSLRQQVTVNLVIRISRFNLTSPKPYTVRLSLCYQICLNHIKIMITLRKDFPLTLKKLINYPIPSRFSHNSLILLEESD